jgi:hypothetical protein
MVCRTADEFQHTTPNVKRAGLRRLLAIVSGVPGALT